MKDRIRQIMETQHMTQQVFAQLIELAPATLSSIFNGRTRPTLNVVEAIKKKIPDINTEWLLFGTGKMYASASASDLGTDMELQSDVMPELNFDDSESPTSGIAVQVVQNQPQQSNSHNSVRNIRSYNDMEIMKNFDKNVRRVTEIRVFYDDLTYESFVPAKK